MGTEKRAVVNPERTDAADELVDQVEVDTEQPDDPSEIAERAADAADDPDVDVVAAVGGDGTQRTVAEAIAGSDTELAIVPGGTVNLLGRVHGIETVEDAADAIERGEAHPFDLARCDGHAYLLNSSSGLDAAMIAAVDDRAKRFGRAGYTAMGLLELIRAKPSHVSVVVDGETRVRKILEAASKDLGSEVKVAAFRRFVLGEGIEREETDFAAEVAAQLES